jgi:histidinol-phosphate/aromatic aminotransferase/cobyric acid decarboxylase-like protein
VACLAAGASVVEFRAQMTDDFQLDTAAVSTWIMIEQPVLVWLCNPNNPTGIWLDQQALLQVMDACQHAGAMLVVDESYWRFVFPHASSSAIAFVDTTRRSQLIVLRSLTKDCALAGLRLGYAVADPQVVELLHAQLPSWNVNGLAQAAGYAALSDRTHLKTTVEKLADERQKFFDALENTGLHVLPSRTHFCLLDVGNAYSVRQQLLTRKMLVRDCTSFGLPQYIRVATRPQSEWQQLLTALREII